MCRLFGYTLSDFSLFQLALSKTGDALRPNADEGPFDGWGLGFYQDDRPLLRKRPKPSEGDVSFVELASDIRSSLVVGHLQRQARGGKASENMQPFRFRNWLFASLHDDTDALYHATQARLPDFLKRNVRGQTSSEALTHLFFDHLRKSARIESAILPPAVLFDALRSTLSEVGALVPEASQERPLDISLLFTTGRMLVAVNQSERPWAYLETRGLEDQEAPLFAGHQPKTLSYPEFKSVCVAFDPAPSELSWNTLPPHHLIAIDERFQVHIEAI